MADVLLEVLNDSDINWIITTGQKHQLAAGQVVVRQGDLVESLYIVLDGALIASIATATEQGTIGQALQAISAEPELEQEINHFGAGDILGETSFLNANKSAFTVTVAAPAIVLALPYEQLRHRLAEDLEFASRFYQAMAVLLVQRFNRLLEKFARRRGLQIPPAQDVPLLFGELNDSDVDWMVKHGSLAEVPAEQTLIQARRAVTHLHIVLRGLLSISVADMRKGAINEIFNRLQQADHTDPVGREIARIAQGELVGETALLDSRLSIYTVTTVQPSKLLLLPVRELSLKLQQDLGMAARLYRVFSILLSSRLDSLVSRLGYGKATYQAGQSLSEDVHYADEIDIDLIDNLALGGARFDWMLQRLNV